MRVPIVSSHTNTACAMWRDSSPPLSANPVTRHPLHEPRVGYVHRRPDEHDLAQGSYVELRSKERQVEGGGEREGVTKDRDLSQASHAARYSLRLRVGLPKLL